MTQGGLSEREIIFGYIHATKFELLLPSWGCKDNISFSSSRERETKF